MPYKKQVIDKDGMVRTVVKSGSTRDSRIQQHLHGRNDHIRTKDGDVRFVIGMIVGLLFLMLVGWVGWLLLR